MASYDDTATVSGSVVSIENGADEVGAKSCVVTVRPTLSGVSLINEKQTGRNLLNYADVTNSYRITSLTDNGDGSFTAVASGLGAYIDHVIKVKAGQAYSIKCTSATNDEGNASQIGVVNVYDGSDDTATLLLNGASISTRKGFTPTGNYILVRNKVTGGSGAGTGTIVEPQLELGSSATAYEPYQTPTQYTASLGRTIYGGKVDIVNGEGHNTRIKKTVRWGDLGNVTQLADVTRKEIVLSASEEPKYITAAASTDLLNDKNLPYDMTYSGNYEHIYIANSARIWVYLPNGTDADTEITVSYTLADALQTDFTFDGQEVPTRLGYNAFWSEQGNTELTYYKDGYGFTSVTVNKTGRNLLPDTNYKPSNFSVADDGTVSQITTSASYAWSYANSIFKTTLPAGTYTAIEELLTDSTNASHGVQVFNSSNNMIGRVSSGAKTAGTYSATFTLTQATDIGIVCKLYDGTAKLYIVSGSTVHAYEPYEAVTKTAKLHKVIYGGTADVIRGTCEPKNLFDGGNYFPISEEMTNSYYKEFSATTGRMPRIELVVGTTYTFSLDVTSTVEPFTISIGTGDGRYLKDIANKGYNNSGRVSITFTPTTANIDKGAIMAFRVPRYGTTQNFSFSISNVQLEVSPSASDYTPYFDPFTFPPISIGTDEGENNLFANEGDSSLTYRKETD